MSSQNKPKSQGGTDADADFDAIRTALKQGPDYLWNGTPEVQAWCEKLTSWLYTNVGVDKFVVGYTLDGSPIGSNHNLAHMGSVAVCASANTQEIVDAYVAEAGSLSGNYCYGVYLGNMYLLAISENMWNPEIVSTK